MDKNKFIKTAKGIGVGSLIAAMIVMNGCVKEYSLPVGKDGAETVVITNEKGPIREWLSNKKINGLSVMKEGNLKKIINKGSARKSLETKALPLKFMEEEGLLKTEEIDGFEITCLASGGSNGSATAFAYADTTNNTISTILTVCPGNNVLAYKLTYNVTEDDIKTFKYLDGDPRLNFFIQGLDEVYERNVEFKSISHFSFYSVLADNAGISHLNMYYIDNFNLDNGSIKFIYQTEDGLKSLEAQVELPNNSGDYVSTEYGLCYSPNRFNDILASNLIKNCSEDRPVVISNQDGYYIPKYSKNTTDLNFKEDFNEKIFK